jgi:hypothetical protein
MKTRALVMAGMMALAAMASTRVAQAQTQVPLAVNIPFDFVAGDKTLPAGEYIVSFTGFGHTLRLLDRHDADASALMNTIQVYANDSPAESKLVFNRYGDRYFLSQIWSAGNSQGRQLIKSAREKEVAQTAKIETEGQVTLVASLLRNNP